MLWPNRLHQKEKMHCLLIQEQSTHRKAGLLQTPRIYKSGIYPAEHPLLIRGDASTILNHRHGNDLLGTISAFTGDKINSVNELKQKPKNSNPEKQNPASNYVNSQETSTRNRPRHFAGNVVI